VVTAALLWWLRGRGVNAAAMKPIACGDGREDAEIYWRLMGKSVPLDKVNAVWLRKPLAPLVAARLERKKIDFRKIRACYSALSTQHSALLIEGAGGLMVPIGKKYFVADLAAEMKLPLLIVGGNRLGVLNHALATVECARMRGLKIRGIVLNQMSGERKDLARRTNAAVLRELTGLAVIEFPFVEGKVFEKICGQKKFSVENVRPSEKRGALERALRQIAKICGARY
jgi:dethiobiotin synthetase